MHIAAETIPVSIPAEIPKWCATTLPMKMGTKTIKTKASSSNIVHACVVERRLIEKKRCQSMVLTYFTFVGFFSGFFRPRQYSRCVRGPRVPMRNRSAIHLSVTVVSTRSRCANRTFPDS